MFGKKRFYCIKIWLLTQETVFNLHHQHGLKNISLVGLMKKLDWIYNNKELNEQLVKNLRQHLLLSLKQVYLTILTSYTVTHQEQPQMQRQLQILKMREQCHHLVVEDLRLQNHQEVKLNHQQEVRLHRQQEVKSHPNLRGQI